jgi:rfaE bifunctional protein nucleotidyltransferase chain/domain
MTSHKIVAWNELSAVSEELRRGSARLVLCHGVFDLLHIGHIKHFQVAKSLGDCLIVTLTADEFVRKGPGRPAFPEGLRAQAIAALEAVDRVCVVPHAGASVAIERVRPYRYVKGADYKDRVTIAGSKLQQEIELVRSYGGDVTYTEEEQFSSSTLINRHLSPYSSAAQRIINSLKANVSLSDIEELFSSLSEFSGIVHCDTEHEGTVRKFFPQAQYQGVKVSSQAREEVLQLPHHRIRLVLGVAQVVVTSVASKKTASCIPLSEDILDPAVVLLFASVLDQIPTANPDLLAIVLIVLGQEHHRVASLAGLRKVVESILK